MTTRLLFYRLRGMDELRTLPEVGLVVSADPKHLHREDGLRIHSEAISGGSSAGTRARNYITRLFSSRDDDATRMI
jgi:hypothetical protein